MTEKDSRGFGWLLEQAKTFTVTPKRCREFENKQWISVESIKQELSLLHEKERSLRKLLNEIDALLKNRPHSRIDEHWTGGAFHEYAMPVTDQAFELWFWEFEPKWQEFVGEFEGLKELLSLERPSLENVEEPALRKETKQ